jgi:hypothetical protein
MCVCLPADAQTLPAEPIALASGRITLGGDVSWSVAPNDPGFFNYTDYEHSALRMLRLALMASVKAGNHVTFLAELRSENGDRPEPYGVYVRIRPWTGRQFDVQIGRVPPTFGAFPRRSYAADNPLVGFPFAYQYLTSLRADALPANADELLRMRGRGWLSNYSVGNVAPDRGVPLVSAFRWDTGVQVHTGNDIVDATASVTAGTPSDPRVKDDNDGRTAAGRVAVHPIPGLVVGGSIARGPFISRAASRSAGGEDRSGDFTQTAWGTDVEYSRDYYVVRAEVVGSAWRLPVLGPPAIENPLQAVATFVEGRYKFRPAFYAAARIDHLRFSEITGTLIRDQWEAPLTRFTVGGGYSIQRNLLLKAEYQHNARSGGRVHHLNLAAAQVVFWF